MKGENMMELILLQIQVQAFSDQNSLTKLQWFKMDYRWCSSSN